jgi:choloylglycine hydrolase
MPMQAAFAGTRAVYLGPEDTIITGRSMDWKTDLGSNLWAFPRGMQRDGAAGPTSIRWASKYGSVVATAFEAATADGMNEKGLVANLLYLAESEYPRPSPADKRLPMSISEWTQYALDNYATVSEAVTALREERFYVVPVASPDGQAGTVHLALSDPTGDSAIFESARSPNVFWVNLSDMDFAAGKPVKRLTLTDGAVYAGNAAAQFQPAEPFKFLQATVQ